MSFFETILNVQYQRVAMIVAIMNTAIYALTVSHEWLDWIGIRWTRLLNSGRLGDFLLAWFCISAALLLVYSLLLQIHARGVTWVGIAGLCWCALWTFELIWLHWFLVFG